MTKHFRAVDGAKRVRLVPAPKGRPYRGDAGPWGGAAVPAALALAVGAAFAIGLVIGAAVMAAHVL